MPGVSESHYYAYRDAELKAIRSAHELSGEELALILKCEPRTVYHYLSGAMRMPESRWRLLMLELGLERPDWTPAKRLKRQLAAYTGEDT